MMAAMPPHPALQVPTRADVLPGDAPLPGAAARQALGIGDAVSMDLIKRESGFDFSYRITVVIEYVSARALNGRITACDDPESLSGFKAWIGGRITFLRKHVREIHPCSVHPKPRSTPRKKQDTDDHQTSLI